MLRPFYNKEIHKLYRLMGFQKSTLVAKVANTQLDPRCVAAPLATNVYLFACFAERVFKN